MPDFPYYLFTLAPSTAFPNGLAVRRPYMRCTLTAANGQSFRCVVWPDSGADFSVFPSSFAGQMGIDILTLPNDLTGGVGSARNVTYYYEPMGIDLEGVIQFNSRVAFTDGLEAQGIGLLGQHGFFEQFQVAFNHHGSTFSINPNP